MLFFFKPKTAYEWRISDWSSDVCSSDLAAKVALFDLADYTGDIVSDLFGEDSYFACADAFWTAQMAEVEDRADAYREAGWSEVLVMECGEYFSAWEIGRASWRERVSQYV